MKRLLVVCLAMMLGYAVSAQEAATQEEARKSSLDEKIAKLETRLKKNEKRAAAWEAFRKYAKLSAFIQGQYDWVEERDGKEHGGSSTFHIRRARMILSGDLLNGPKIGKLDYRFLFDIVRVPKNPLIEAWVRYQPIKEFGVQLGQFIPPITFESSQSSSKYEFIDFSYAVSNLAKVGSNDVTGYTSSGRDAGMQIFGGFLHRDGYSIINYNIAVINGNGINAKDDNKSKDVIGRLTIKPIKDLSIALYYQRGEANLSKMENYADYNWSGNAEYVTTHRWGGGLAYHSGKAFARGEYIGGLTGNLISEGAYMQGGYYFSLPKNAGQIWTGAMVDYFCRNTFDYIERDTKNAHIDTRYTLCVGYRPIKFFHFQMAYSLEQRINYTFGNNRHFGNGVKFMATVIF